MPKVTLDEGTWYRCGSNAEYFLFEGFGLHSFGDFVEEDGVVYMNDDISIRPIKTDDWISFRVFDDSEVVEENISIEVYYYSTQKGEPSTFIENRLLPLTTPVYLYDEEHDDILAVDMFGQKTYEDVDQVRGMANTFDDDTETHTMRSLTSGAGDLISADEFQEFQKEMPILTPLD